MNPLDFAPDELDAPFWDGCRHHVFLIHRCTACNRSYWPASTCVDHGSAAMEWHPASGRGEVFTYTVVHHPFDPSLLDKLPYAVAVVKLDEGPFFHTDIVGCDPQAVRIGMRVCVTYDESADGFVVPHFAPDLR